MERGIWSPPVELRFGLGGNRTVTSAFEALICLEDIWPKRTDAEYTRAKIACKAALAGRLTPGEAREAFVSAADQCKLVLR
ncbi:DUF982 domain-containing protein [Mycoplana sp. MJR14]|jgi:hypothetical protein|uniref:DUF982 domain-containing protein n=1 Tax=Mycoplana sp. MJR14 TaxID=3032583 RepID=UPI000DD7A5A8|nr:DUF982 domain-containing protein [Mycoplana sp. MJR14]MDF1631234.1 DUF982 domain-containing protein [Mycoplana sp. MJR14]